MIAHIAAAASSLFCTDLDYYAAGSRLPNHFRAVLGTGDPAMQTVNGIPCNLLRGQPNIRGAFAWGFARNGGGLHGRHPQSLVGR